MRLIRAVLSAVLLLLPAGAAAAEPAFTVLFPDDPATFAEMKSTWFALCLDGGTALKQVSVTGRQPNGRRGAWTDGCREPFVFLKGASWLGQRKVPTFEFEKQEASAKIKTGDAEVNLWVTAEEPNGPYLYVEDGGETQYFWTRPGETWDQWNLLWAGDLDGDGRPDFITHTWNKDAREVRTDRALFLSSQKSGDELYATFGRPFEKPR